MPVCAEAIDAVRVVPASAGVIGAAGGSPPPPQPTSAATTQATVSLGLFIYGEARSRYGGRDCGSVRTMAMACCTYGTERANASTFAAADSSPTHPSMWSTRRCTVTHNVVPG